MRAAENRVQLWLYKSGKEEVKGVKTGVKRET